MSERKMHPAASDDQRAATPVTLADVEIHTMMDQAFSGEYYLTPTLHSHPYYEIMCTVEGTFEIGFTDGTSISMPENSLCVIPPNLYHRTYASLPGVRKLAVQFHYHRVRSTQTPLYDSFHEAVSRVTVPKYFVSPEVCSLMKKIRGEMHGNSAGSEVMQGLLNAQLYITLMRLLQASAQKNAKTGPENDSRNLRYLQIEGFLSQHCTDPVTAMDLAFELGLSRRQLDRVFMDIYGMSFRARLIELRMSLAANQLATTDIPVETIAAQVGYSTLSGFYMAFRKQHGMSAAKYRQWFRDTFNNET